MNFSEDKERGWYRANVPNQEGQEWQLDNSFIWLHHDFVVGKINLKQAKPNCCSGILSIETKPWTWFPENQGGPFDKTGFARDCVGIFWTILIENWLSRNNNNFRVAKIVVGFPYEQLEEHISDQVESSVAEQTSNLQLVKEFWFDSNAFEVKQYFLDYFQKVNHYRCNIDDPVTGIKYICEFYLDGSAGYPDALCGLVIRLIMDKEIEIPWPRDDVNWLTHSIRAGEIKLRQDKQNYCKAELFVSTNQNRWNFNGDLLPMDTGISLIMLTWNEIVNDWLSRDKHGVQEEKTELGNGKQPTGESQKTNKSKRGPHKLSNEEKITAIEEWDKLEAGSYSGTLEDWLEQKFGTSYGVLNVKPSTFHGWRKLKNS